MAERSTERPVWQVAIGTGIGYAVILIAMFVLLFVVPYLVFRFA